jgi:hypothetical protein
VKVVDGNVDVSFRAILALDSFRFGPVSVDGGHQFDVGRRLRDLVAATLAETLHVRFRCSETKENYRLNEICMCEFKCLYLPRYFSMFYFKMSNKKYEYDTILFHRL